jgi:hypothetical protein
VILVLGFSPQIMAAIGSDNFYIQVSVFSCGGSIITSASYKQESVIGLPSPLADQDEPTFSDSYDLYPGFWYLNEPILQHFKAMPWIPLLLLEE